MKFLKTLFLASVVVAAVPAFASEEFSLGGDDSLASSDIQSDATDYTSDVEMDRDHGRGGHGRDYDRRRPRPRFYTCFAQNATGRQFAARDWNPNRAQNHALRACRSRSFGPIGFSCRAIGCR